MSQSLILLFSGAYKQLRTSNSDVRQQFFWWMGKFFAELCLVFGSSSSVGLYDRLAKVFLVIAAKLSQMPRDQVEQIIDDTVAAGTKSQVQKFYFKYREVAMDCGVKLAPEDNPKKAFAARQEGEVFGVNYNTVSWTWWLSEEKLGVIIDMLLKLEEGSEHTLLFLKRITGKLMAYRRLVPQGKFHLGQLVKVSSSGSNCDMMRIVTVSDWARYEAWFWRTMLPFCAHRVRLPDPDSHLPPWALHAFTDSAGGVPNSWGRGAGAVMEDGWWSYLPWGDVINSNLTFVDGVLYRNKMSAWELVGPLLVLTAGVERVRDQSLVVPVDNDGSVKIFQKGWCTSCVLCSTLVLAISEVAAAINCKIEIVQITRCSNTMASAADAISKGDIRKLRSLVANTSSAPAKVPKALISWVANPVGDRRLGEKLLLEMGVERNLLGHQSDFI